MRCQRVKSGARTDANFRMMLACVTRRMLLHTAHGSSKRVVYTTPMLLLRTLPLLRPDRTEEQSTVISASVCLSVCLRFYRAMLCMRGTSHGPVSVCPSVRPSVTSRSSTKTAKRRITQTTRHDSPGTLVFGCQRSPRNSTGVTPCGGAKQVGWVKIGDFRQIAGYISKTVQDRRMVSIKVE